MAGKDYRNSIRAVGSIRIHTRTYRWLSAARKNPIWYQEKLEGLTEIYYYKSGWADEWRLVTEELGNSFEISETSGRSSATFMPFFTLRDARGKLHSFALLYSGNWKISLKRWSDGSYWLSIGFDDAFRTTALEFVTPSVARRQVKGGWAELSEDWQAFSEALMPQNALQQSRPVVWNHWWAYEDSAINETVFLENARLAREIGVELCVLDAGWFGSAGAGNWYDLRGDWATVNQVRFPSGIAQLSENVHKLGMKFGLWVEIEAAGKSAALSTERPDFLAMRTEKSLGALCFGSESVVHWALETASHLIDAYQCEWIKFDFNLDLGSGCDSLEHGHGREDGLYAHYQGLYTFFEILQQRYPAVVFENCSSGGLRTDFGLLQYCHFSFLSDADYPKHKKRVFSNASQFISPRRLYHFVPSQALPNVEGLPPFPSTDFANLSDDQIREMMRMGALTTMGISHRLTDYSPHILNLMAEEIQNFKDHRNEYI